MEDILSSGETLHPKVMPVLDKAVQVFKKPPKKGTQQKQGQEKAGSTDKQAATGASPGQTVDADDETQPQGEKGIGLHGGKPLEPGPGH